jgi:hypothetical protein
MIPLRAHARNVQIASLTVPLATLPTAFYAWMDSTATRISSIMPATPGGLCVCLTVALQGPASKLKPKSVFNQSSLIVKCAAKLTGSRNASCVLLA